MARQDSDGVRLLRLLTSAAVAAGMAFGASASEIVPIDAADREAINDALHLNNVQLQRLVLPDTVNDHMVVNVRLDGRIVLLDLHRRSVMSDEAQLLLDMGNGEMIPLPRPEVRTYRGVARGFDDAPVAATLTEDGLRVFILTNEGVVYSIQPLADTPELPAHLDPTLHAVFSDFDSREIPNFCGGAIEHEEAGCCPGHGSESSTRGSTCLRVIEMVIDIDNSMYNSFSGNTTTITNNVNTIINSTNVIYERDVAATIVVTNFVFRTTLAPYNDTTSSSSLLNQMASHWGGQPTANRDLVHMFTNRNMGGVLGIAWLSGLCSASQGTALSRYNAYASFANKTKIVAHEIGHNCGAPHDNESGSSCAATPSGFLMNPFIQTGSSPSFSTFSDCSVIRITNRFNNSSSSCLGQITEQIATTQPDSASTLVNNSVTINVLINDSDPCGIPEVELVSESSFQGGTVALGNLVQGRRQVVYTPPVDYSGPDSFVYRAVNAAGSSAPTNVTVTVVAGRVPENPSNALPGVFVEYFALEPIPEELPDFDALTPYGDAVFTFVNLIATTGNILSSGRSDNLGMRLNGYVTVPQTAIYTFELESDDGSRMYIGDTLLVDNDMFTGNQLASAQIALAPGAHKITILYYEADGTARLQPRLSGPGFTGGVIPASAWSYVVEDVVIEPCPCDRDGDGFQTIGDYFVFLNEFFAQLGGPGSADFDGDGTVTIGDYFSFLACLSAIATNQACP